MPHLGTQPPVGFKTTTKQSFSGDNSTTAFTLNRASSSETDLEVFVDNIQQEPTTAYSVSGTTLTFTEAPPTGTNNVYVVNRGGDQNGTLPPQDLGTTDYIFGDDISFNSDGAVINMGVDSEIKITHVADTGILLTDSGGSPTLQLHDSNESVSSDGSNLILTSGGTAFTLPTSDGTSGQALVTNASGVLSFATAGSNTPTSADGQALGSASLEWSDLFLADGGQILFGNDQEITLTHVADSGLTLKHAATADDKFPTLTLAAGDTDIAASDKLGVINFQAPDEGAGTDAILVAAGIEAVSEGDFSSSSNATSLVFKTGASEAAAEQMRINSAGRVGIGTTDIDAALDIVDSVEYVRIASSTSDDTTKTGGLAVRHRDNEEEDFHVISGVSGSSSNIVNIGGSDFIGSLNAATAIAFFTASDRTTVDGTQRMVIAEDGRVGVGLADPSSRFAVSSTGIGEHPVQIFGTSATFGNHVIELQASRNTSNGSFKFLQAEVTSVSGRCEIRDSGDLRNVNNTYGAISDQNLKENIVDAASQWDDIKGLKVRKFNYKESTGMPTHTQIGLIAQEVETVSAGLVDTGKWNTKETRDEDGKLTSGGEGTWKSLKYSVVHMKSLKALQEAMTRIETLETKVKTLEGG